jgi:hypothetical protein
MQEFALDTCDLPENTLMECVRTIAPLARTSAQTFHCFRNTVFLELAKGFEPLTL